MKSLSGVRGSAMIVAVIVVIIVIGVGGAFLADTVYKTKTTARAIDADEATIIAEATLEKARRALYVYKRDNTWPWEEILAYCENFSTDGNSLYQQFNTSLFESSEFVSYRSGMNSSGAATRNEAPLPGDPDVFFGVTKPYSQGGANVVIRDNDDGDADPLVDSDLQLIVFVSSFLPDGTIRQIEALVQYESPTFNPDSAILTDGTLLMNGSPEVTGKMGKVHANIDVLVNGSSVKIDVSANAGGSVILTGSPSEPSEGFNSGVPKIPIPDVVPSEHLQYATFLLTSDGRITNPNGTSAGTPGAGAFEGMSFSAGQWNVSSNKAVSDGTYYVQGSIKITGQGNIQMRRMTVIAEGNIETTGNAKLLPHLMTGTGPEGGVLLLAGGDIKLGGTAGSAFGASNSQGTGIQALIAAHEQIQVLGTPEIMGVLVAKDAEDLSNLVSSGSQIDDQGAQFGGSARLRYDGGLLTMLENPSNSVKIRNVRKIR